MQLALVIATLCCVVLFAFVFWASSPNQLPAKYSLLIEKELPATVDEDSIYSIFTYNMGYLSGMTNNLPVIGKSSFYDKNLKKSLDKSVAKVNY